MDFRRAGSLDEALHLLSELGSDAHVLAGGTDVMIQYLSGELTPHTLVHIEGIEALAQTSHNTRTTLGPLVTHATLATQPDLVATHPALSTAAGTVGGWQTQVVGTVGGNLCNASPAADTAPPLLVADAHVTLSSSTASRRLPLAEFFVDRRVTARNSDELLTAIDLAPMPARSGEVYLKLARRGAMEVALVGLAMRLSFAPDGLVESAAIALSSMAPTPRRVAGAEAALVGSALDSASLDAAGEALRLATAPIDDARASASYRTRTLRGLVERGAIECREMATT